jgi:hypothetical protein
MEEKPLQEYVDSAQSVIEDSPQMQEATTKASLLNDFVELLGWEIPKNTAKPLGRHLSALLLEHRPHDARLGGATNAQRGMRTAIRTSSSTSVEFLR